jgi:transposase
MAQRLRRSEDDHRVARPPHSPLRHRRDRQRKLALQKPRLILKPSAPYSKANREAARARGIAPVIPHKTNERDKPAFFARTLYKARSRIEQGVGRLKHFKRAALRCEKTARNFRSIVSFAAGLCLIKFVHTA